MYVKFVIDVYIKLHVTFGSFPLIVLLQDFPLIKSLLIMFEVHVIYIYIYCIYFFNIINIINKKKSLFAYHVVGFMHFLFIQNHVS